jgi:hypothetical protein
MPPSLTDRTACLGLELLSCELLVNPADVLVLNVNKKPFELYHARKALVKTLLDPLRRQQECVTSSNITSLYAPRVLSQQFPPQLPSADHTQSQNLGLFAGRDRGHVFSIISATAAFYAAEGSPC